MPYMRTVFKCAHVVRKSFQAENQCLTRQTDCTMEISSPLSICGGNGGSGRRILEELWCVLRSIVLFRDSKKCLM